MNLFPVALSLAGMTASIVGIVHEHAKGNSDAMAWAFAAAAFSVAHLLDKIADLIEREKTA